MHGDVTSLPQEAEKCSGIGLLGFPQYRFISLRPSEQGDACPNSRKKDHCQAQVITHVVLDKVLTHDRQAHANDHCSEYARVQE